MDLSDKLSNEVKKNFYEANLLKLNYNKAKKKLGWSNLLKFDESIQLTAEWYQNYYLKKKDITSISISQTMLYKKRVLKNLI